MQPTPNPEALLRAIDAHFRYCLTPADVPERLLRAAYRGQVPDPEKKPAKVWPKGEMPVWLAGKRGGRMAKGNQYTRATAKRLAAEAAQAQEKGAE